MPIDWSAITIQHVQRACDAVAARCSDRDRGLVVYAGGRCLPAKDVLREAYRLAKELAPETEVRFASGEATLGVLRKLGLRAERLTSRGTPDPQA